MTLQATVKRLERSNLPNLSCVFCGEGAVYTTMYAARALGADTVSVLRYANSADAGGNPDRVVGYLAAAFSDATAASLPDKETSMTNTPFSVGAEDQQRLLIAARQSVTVYLAKKTMPPLDAHGSIALNTPAAVFVTLNERGSLRGCIGTTAPEYPLLEAVSRMAVAAAFQDYRFPPVNEGELNDLHIEISVLSPLTKIDDPALIQPGVHGVVIKKGGRSGLFLPQVWEHFNNELEPFMAELCSQKAGLPRDAWKKPNAGLAIFTVFSFEENE